MKKDNELEILKNGIRIEPNLMDKYKQKPLETSSNRKKSLTNKRPYESKSAHSIDKDSFAEKNPSNQNKVNKESTTNNTKVKPYSISRAVPSGKKSEKKKQIISKSSENTSKSQKMQGSKKQKTKNPKASSSKSEKNASGSGLVQGKISKNDEIAPIKKMKSPRQRSPHKKRHILNPELIFVSGSFVYDKVLKTYHRVESCTFEKVTLHKSGHDTYSITFEETINRLIHVSTLHIGVLKKYFRKEFIRKRISDPSFFVSKEIITNSKISLQNMNKLHSSFVPDILTDEEWDSWVKRVDKHLESSTKEKPVPHLNTSSSEVYKASSLREVWILPQEFIIKVQSFNCINNNHQLEPITGVIYIRKNSKEGVVPHKIQAGYCHQCKIYFIHSDVYECLQLVRLNVTCEIIDERDYGKSRETNIGQWDNFAKESILKRCGYSVSNAENPGDQVRLKILHSLIENNIMERVEILDFINWLIEKRKHIPHMSDAVKLWRHDYSRLSDYEVGRNVEIKAIRGK